MPVFDQYRLLQFIYYFAATVLRTIVMSVSVCRTVRTHISKTTAELHQFFLCMLTVAWLAALL